MEVNRHQLIILRVTPKQLREMADNLERRFQSSMIGDPVSCFERWSDDRSVKVEFSFEQCEHDRETKKQRT